jgi:hypothetical protein
MKKRWKCRFDMKQLVMIVAVALAGCASPQPGAKLHGEVIDTVELPKLPEGKTRVDFDRESTVSTRVTNDESITEYRFKGQLYKMVIRPRGGPAYTLVDERGEGKFTRIDGPVQRLSVPMWVLFSW